jgi:hypothetical protein
VDAAGDAADRHVGDEEGEEGPGGGLAGAGARIALVGRCSLTVSEPLLKVPVV